MSLRVVLAEDHNLLREGLLRLMQAEPDLTVVGACADLPSLIGLIDTERPDVVVTDIRMPPSRTDEGIQAAEHCRRVAPGTGVVVLSQYVEPSYVRALLARGTEGCAYLLKERVSDAGELVDAIRAVASGGSVIDPKVVDALVLAKGAPGAGDLARLTPRELDVLSSMAEGHNNAAIANSLFISQRAVEKHINAIFSKLGLATDQESHPRVRAVLLFLAGGGT